MNNMSQLKAEPVLDSYAMKGTGLASMWLACLCYFSYFSIWQILLSDHIFSPFAPRGLGILLH